MNEKTKNYVAAAVIISLLVFAYAAFSYTQSYSKSIDPISSSDFTVTGEGKVVAIPDVAKFTFSVITQGGKDITVLQKNNTEKSNNAIEYLKSIGVEAKDIQTQSYNVEPRYQYFSCPQILSSASVPCPPPEIVGYTVNQTVSVKVRDFTKIGDALSNVITKGANTVSQISFTIDDPTSLESQARAKAIVQAREKAEAIAKAAGFRVGKIRSIDEGYFPSPVFSKFGMGGVAESTSATPSPTIEPGSQEVTASVTIRYEIK
ncbi:MAG: SIMPL domain-containing protein [bacterium]|nr:SIMPL domain-containing protein [bacterium]